MNQHCRFYYLCIDPSSTGPDFYGGKNHSKKTKYLGIYFFLNLIFSQRQCFHLNLNYSSPQILAQTDFSHHWFTPAISFYFPNLKYPFSHFCFMERFFFHPFYMFLLLLSCMSAKADVLVSFNKLQIFSFSFLDIFGDKNLLKSLMNFDICYNFIPFNT